VALDLTEDSYGNALGIGNADFTTRRLADKIDMKMTLINCIAACQPNSAKVPATYDTDREAVETALSCIGMIPAEKARVIRIKNTLALGEIECSEAYLPSIAQRPDLEVVGEGAPSASTPTAVSSRSRPAERASEGAFARPRGRYLDSAGTSP
jgi:hypothetical protein